METTNTTYIIGTSRAGTIHRAAKSAPYQAECMYGSYNRGKIGSLRTVEQGTTPAGTVCQKCFPAEVAS